MTIQEIYKTWNEQWDKEEIRSHGMYMFPEIVYEIRELDKIWSKKEIEILSGYLMQDDKKWFVANLFSLQKNIPEQLFEHFIDAAIKETDPSFNQEYINPCLRVFGFERVFKLLNQRFIKGNNQIKIGVCKAFYWARSPLVKVNKGNDTWETKGYLSKWNGYYYGDYDWDNGKYFEMTESQISECKKITNKLLIERRKLLLEEFFKNPDTDVRYQVKLALPNELSSFSLENKELAKSYFIEKEKDFVPDNYSDLQFKKRFGFLAKNSLFKYFLRKNNERIEKKGLITLKNK
ncbi:hypothetical protein [Aquimarina rhabdastrellae]